MLPLIHSLLSAGAMVAVVFQACKILQRFVDCKKQLDKLKKFPHDPCHWLWGHLKQFPGPNEEGLQWQRELTARFPYVHVAVLGPFFGMLVLNHPQVASTVLRSSEPKPKLTYGLLKLWLGDGLLLSGGDKWSRNRHLLTPAFHFDILRHYATIKNRATDVFLEKMEGYHKRGEYFEVFSVVSLLTLDIILKCAFSYNTDCQRTGGDHPYVKAVFDITDLFVERFLRPWLHPDWVYFLTPNGRQFRKCCDYVHSVAEEIIRERRQALAQTGGQARAGQEETGRLRRCLDFLDILLTARDENNQGLTTAEIRDEVDTFLFEGHDTTASAISWMMFSFAEHPDIQTKAQEEVDSLLDGRDCQDILWEDLSRLPYLTMCLKETMRMHTPVPSVQRELTQDTRIHGILAPKGTVVNINIYSIHHNSSVWEDDMEFRPERFLPDNLEDRDVYTFIPFSAGPRNCIGQHFAMNEIKIVIARLLRRFTLKLDQSHVVRRKQAAVMKAENGIMMKVIPRTV